MVTFKLNEEQTYAQEFVDGIATGRWLNTETNPEFQAHIMDGGELQDADGVVMTDAQEFVTSLP